MNGRSGLSVQPSSKEECVENAMVNRESFPCAMSLSAPYVCCHALERVVKGHPVMVIGSAPDGQSQASIGRHCGRVPANGNRCGGSPPPALRNRPCRIPGVCRDSLDVETVGVHALDRGSTS